MNTNDTEMGILSKDLERLWLVMHKYELQIKVIEQQIHVLTVHAVHVDKLLRNIPAPVVIPQLGHDK